MKRFVFVLLLCLDVQVAFGAPSLCQKGEDNYFSCKAHNGKIISLCGQVSTDDYPWLQYRYGRPGAIELAYPQSRKDSVQRFKAERIRAGGGAYGVDGVAFVSGSIGYSVDAVTPDTGEFWQGVSVGDPKGFDLERGARRPAHYPEARIVCGAEADTKRFSGLIELLDQR